MIGFDKKDGAILAALGKKEQNMLTLAKMTKIQRDTISYRLKRLARLGLVEIRPSRGKQIVWGLSTKDTQTNQKIQIYYGDDMIRAYALLLKIPRKTIIYVIQGSEYVRLINDRMQTAAPELFEKIQRNYRTRNIIIKTLTHPKAIQAFRQTSERWESLVRMQRNRGRTPFRLLETTKSLLGPCCIAALPKQLFLFNESDRYVVVINDEMLTQLTYDMVEILFDLLEYSHEVKQFNFAAFLEIIAQKAQK